MKIIDKNVQVERTHLLELSQSEVNMIKTLLGQCITDGPSSGLFAAFRTIATDTYYVENSGKVPALRLAKV